MPRKQISSEQIITKLREAEVLLRQGKDADKYSPMMAFTLYLRKKHFTGFWS